MQSDTIHRKREMKNFCFNLAEQALINRGLSIDENREKLARAVAHALQRASIELANLAAGNLSYSGVSLTDLGRSRNQRMERASAKPFKIQALYDGWAAEKATATRTKYS